MNSTNIYSIIRIDIQSVTPKYLQISNAILQGIESGCLGKDYLLPSINDLSYELEISRDAAERAYRYLKEMGVVGSVPGKGYFIATTEFRQPVRVFLLFNKLSTHKKIIYDSFVKTLGENAAVDFYIYNNNFLLFKKLLSQNRQNYSYYVIVPHFLEGGENAAAIINAIPKEKLLLMSKLLPEVTGKYASVYEDFEKDIFSSLEQLIPRLSKYDTIKIIFPAYTYHPVEILQGFISFCQHYAFNYAVVDSIESEIIQAGTAYVSLMEDDLVILIEKILNTNLVVGTDVGVISYNETPLKRIILNGITTISSDFEMMGIKAAQMILAKSTEKVAIPFVVNLRNSL
jgi:DNA-binding transcriptional regulator YhcF (GntR family)